MNAAITVSITPATLPDPGRIGWHWIADTGRLSHSRRKVLAGRTYHVDPPTVPCWRGLHASASPLDALASAPGALICRVWSSGTVVEGGYQYTSSDRAVLWLADATTTLHEFSCRCAEAALLNERAAGREPDARYFAAIACKRRWLAGEVPDAELASARKAVLHAVGGNATVAAWEATWHAADDNAREAAREAARQAAWENAKLAAREVVRNASRDAVSQAARDAVWDAVWKDSWLASREAQSVLLSEMLMALAPAGWKEAR